jgi:hypothetical protein
MCAHQPNVKIAKLILSISVIDECQYRRLKEKYDQQEQQLHQMIMRDIDDENLRIENTNLCKEIQ